MTKEKKEISTNIPYIYDDNSKSFVDTSDNRVQIEIGDTKDKNIFHPRVKLKAWGNECNVSFGLEDVSSEIPEIVQKDDKIKWIKKDIEAHFYTKDIAEQWEEGAYEFEILLHTKPRTNIINLTMNTSKNLKFLYQRPITRDEINHGFTQNENSVGSWAVYHSSKENNEYKTGKAFHIFRPFATDSNGNATWCELNIDSKKQVASIVIPLDFYSNAVYPVMIDPTFGYTTAGSGGNASLGYYGPYYQRVLVPVPAYVQTLHGYNNISFSRVVTRSYRYGIYNENKRYVALSVTGSGATSSKEWRTLAMDDNPFAVPGGYIYIVANSQYNSILSYLAYDTGFSNEECGYDDSSWENWPSTLIPDYTASDRKLSLYATYEPINMLICGCNF